MVRKLDKAIINAKVFATHTLDNMKRKVSGDETLIIKIMLMVIAVALVIIFRNTLQTIIEKLLTDPKDGLQTKIQDLYTKTTTQTPSTTG